MYTLRATILLSCLFSVVDKQKHVNSQVATQIQNSNFTTRTRVIKRPH